MQTLAEMHGQLRTHADIKLDNIHVAVKPRPADTAVTVLDFGISGYPEAVLQDLVVTLVHGCFVLVETHGFCPLLDCSTRSAKLAGAVPCPGCNCLVPCASAAPCLCLRLEAASCGLMMSAGSTL